MFFKAFHCEMILDLFFEAVDFFVRLFIRLCFCLGFIFYLYFYFFGLNFGFMVYY